MKRKKPNSKPNKQPRNTIWLDDQNLASIRLSAIQVAAHLPEAEPSDHPMMGGSGYPGRPGKTADKVVADAEKIMGFITKK